LNGFFRWIVPSLLNTVFNTTTDSVNPATGITDTKLTLFGNALRNGLLIDSPTESGMQPARIPLAVMKQFFVEFAKESTSLARSCSDLYSLMFGHVNAKTFEEAFVLAMAAKFAAHQIARKASSMAAWWPSDVQRPVDSVQLFRDMPGLDCTNALFPPCVILNGDAATINAIQFPIGVVPERNVLVVKGSLWEATWEIDDRQTWVGGSRRTVMTELEHGIVVHSSLSSMEAIDGLLLVKLTSGAMHLVLLQMKHSANDADNTQRFPELVTATVNAQRLLTSQVLANEEHPLTAAGFKSLSQVTLCFVLLRDVPAKFDDAAAVKMTFGNYWTYGVATKPARGTTKTRATMPAINVVALTSDSVRGHFGASHEFTPFLELSAGASLALTAVDN
jgi:hypothetical protein